ncbi:GntR family transcriptional regulator [Anaeropeptidivorans aminofermentans]|jgi:GntR family transcriptional regulator|uniref:GntR family transcriptional regulator n=1 Tax=Anaeropeptidivorans aminofermentans TaxID=2934315 RepID=UPI0020240450|nr:GntR family transcriptional regulator [Anaeropeptidivorans aminofermentans]MBE6011493.1 GntR family transcriptional regulator [Lachnospiraceae bacterium]
MNADFGVRVDKKVSIPIHEQIYMQIKNQILAGELAVGDKLPSVRQMSDLINVNRHTISRAYLKLEEEGIVETFASSGTFVKGGMDVAKQKQTETLLEIISELFQKANTLGFDSNEVVAMAFAEMIRGDAPKRKGLFVDCNPYALKQYIEDVQREVELDVDGILLDDERLIKGGEGLELEKYDIIMTTIGHYAEVKSKLKKENIYALDFGPYLSVVNQIRQLDSSFNIAIVCINPSGTEGLLNVLVDLGIPKKKLFTASLNDMEDFHTVMNNVEVLVVSKYALQKDREAFEETGKIIIEYKNALQATSVTMLKQILAMYESEQAKRAISGASSKK